MSSTRCYYYPGIHMQIALLCFNDVFRHGRLFEIFHFFHYKFLLFKRTVTVKADKKIENKTKGLLSFTLKIKTINLS